MGKVITKVTSAIITTILVFSNLLVLGGEVIAYGGELEEQNTKTNNSKVEFNSYFDDGVHGKEYKTTEEGKIYLNLKVKEEGYLKDIVVNFSNANFIIDSDKIKSEYVQKVNDNKDTITLNSINKGEEVTIEVPIKILNEENVKADNFSKVTDVILTANYIDINGNTKAVTKTIKTQVEWNGTAEIENTTQLSKYIPYNVGEEYGVIFQSLISNKVKDNSMPVKEQITTVEVPLINEAKPEEVKVTVNNTNATNGKENGVEFNQDNYTYNKENGKLEIKLTNNPNDQNNISWKKNSVDEILVNFIYKGKEVYDYVLSNEVKGTLKLNVKMSLYNNVETNINKDFAYDYTLKDKIGNINTVSISSNEKISKGYIYANYDKKDGLNETIYNENYIIDIAYAGIENELELNQAIDKFEINDEKNISTTVGGTNYTYNKKIKVAEDIFKKMLGKDGKIEVFKTDKTKIGEINKDTEKDNTGKYILDISKEDVNQVTIKTSKPIIEGKIEIEIEKAIKGKLDYSKSQIREVSNLSSEVALKTSTEAVSGNIKIKMEEPVSKAKLTINKSDLSTLVKNENVEIRALLDTSNVYNALYKNPIIEIELPEYIETIEIKSSKLLFEDELKYKKAELIERNGKKVIRIEFEGTQTKYNTENTEIQGATVVISADVTLNKLTPRKNEQIVMYYTNENTDLYETSNITPERANINNETNSVVRAKANSNAQEIKGMVKTDVNFVVPTGVMVSAGIDNYKEGASGILSITDESVDVEIAPFANKRIATVKGTLTNNNTNPISNVCILGRFPSQGNKKIDSTDDLGNTTTFSVSKAISVLGMDTSKIEVYYSEKTDANKDLKDTSNGWTTSPTDLTKAKSYLIVLKDKIEATGTIEFNYEIELPNNIGYNKNAATMYKTYYTNEASEATMAESKQAPILNLTTGKGPELEIKVSSSAAADGRVFNGQYVRLYVEVKNTGDLDAVNAKLTVDVPEQAYFVTFDEGANVYDETNKTSDTIDIGTIKAGSTAKAIFEVRTNRETNIPQDGYPEETVMNVIAKVSADNIEGEIKSEEYKFKVEEIGKYEFINAPNTQENRTYLNGETVNYEVKFHNKTMDTIKNATLTIPMPTSAKVEQVTVKIGDTVKTDGINTQADKIVITLGDLETNAKVNVNVKYILGANTPNEFSTKASIDSDLGFTLYSNERWIHFGNVGMKVEQVKPAEQYVKEREAFRYVFRITANGGTNIYNATIVDTLAPEVYYNSATAVIKNYNNSGEDMIVAAEIKSEDGKVTVKIPEIFKGETAEVYIYVTGELENPDDDGKAIVNKAIAYADGVNETTVNEVTHYLEYKPTAEEEIETQKNGYKISGVAWVDSNKDGERQDDESKLSDVKVMLLYKENNQVVTDSKTGERKIATTDNNGKYEFTGLQPNNYLVVFVYDNSRYTITTYQKNGVPTTSNSDAINMEVVLDGNKTNVGMTDTIKVVDKNIRYIDIGVYGEEKFDLKLDKFITKITLTTPTIGTSQTDYDNETFTKVEILRQNAGKSNIVVEYKIVVTNEGAIPGYANKIIDYLPEDVTFSSEVNPDWYISKNGDTIYSSSLANKKINPGESKEIKLVLTKKLTPESLGSIMSNTSEIYEATNDAGLQDIDSEPANKLESEDDFGQADIVLSVVTGKIVGYSIIIVIALGIVVTGIIIIKKKVLSKK